jgi:hypothetical protein
VSRVEKEEIRVFTVASTSHERCVETAEQKNASRLLYVAFGLVGVKFHLKHCGDISRAIPSFSFQRAHVSVWLDLLRKA